MNNNMFANDEISKFCHEFVNLDAFKTIKEIAPVIFIADPTPETLVEIMNAHATTVLETYICSLLSLAQEQGLSTELFRGMN